MKIFRASYSTLAAWARGDYDLAIGMYYRTTKFDTEAMRRGREYHDQWDKEIKATGRLPEIFGGKQLPEKHNAEIFARKMITPWLEVRGKLDLKAGDVGYDWKSGVTPSTQWAQSYQHKVYKVLYPHLKRFEYHAFNPVARKDRAVSVSIVHLTPKSLEEGVEWLVTHASEMKHYIEQNGIEEKMAAKGIYRK